MRSIENHKPSKHTSKQKLKTKKLFLVVNVDWFFLSHRLPIALAAKKRGYEVTVFAIEEGGHGNDIRGHGLKFVPLPTSRSGTNIFTELKVLVFLFRYYKKERPDIIHHVAVKPVTYGSVAAKLTGVPKVVNALSGLGFLFINADTNRLAHTLVNAFFNYGFKNPNLRFILQNRDDFQMIEDMNVLKEEQIFMIKGSGVNLNEFAYSAERELEGGKVKILLPARMLWDKGVGEFVAAAKIVHQKLPNRATFILAGNIDMGNRARILEAQLEAWNLEGMVQWIGFQKNIAEVIRSVHIVVLPSYREGLPKSLIEACAIGRPIITTDVPGCREVVEEGKNGFLVPKKDTIELAERLTELIMNKQLRTQMGKAGRQKAEREFSIENVLQQTFEIYEN